MYVIRNNTPVTLAIVWGFISWTPFLDEVNDGRLPTDVVASPALSYSVTLLPINHLLPSAGTPRPVLRRLMAACPLHYGFLRTYSAAVWWSWGLPVPGAGSAACSRRSEKSA